VLETSGGTSSGSIDGVLPITNASKDTGALTITFDTSETSANATVTETVRPGVSDEMNPTYRYTYSGASSDDYPVRDSFRYSVTNLGGTSATKEVRVVVFAPGAELYSANDLAAGALVVWNVNAPEAQTIADYYRSARGIDAGHSCPVEMPTGLYASKDQLLSLRRQIVEGCICPLVAAEVPPGACTVGSDALAEASPVDHLVLIKGLPARLYGTGWSGGNNGDQHEPSLDYYLSYLLYRAEDIFAGTQPPPPATYHDGQAMEYPNYRVDLSPDIDRFVAWGRVEAITTERTLDLIDRTLAAERFGISGNILTNDLDLSSAARDPTGSYAPACRDYHDLEPLDPA